ncbi:MAG: hypothetical protein ABSG58_00035 [Acidimicrobiales bacterium]
MRSLRGPAVALVGATASGKSALAHELAIAQGNVDIVSVDAMCGASRAFRRRYRAVRASGSR